MPPNISWTPPTHPLNAIPIPQEALTLSWKVNECKPLAAGRRMSASAGGRMSRTRSGSSGVPRLLTLPAPSAQPLDMLTSLQQVGGDREFILEQ